MKCVKELRVYSVQMTKTKLFIRGLKSMALLLTLRIISGSKAGNRNRGRLRNCVDMIIIQA